MTKIMVDQTVKSEAVSALLDYPRKRRPASDSNPYKTTLAKLTIGFF